MRALAVSPCIWYCTLGQLPSFPCCPLLRARAARPQNDLSQAAQFGPRRYESVGGGFLCLPTSILIPPRSRGFLACLVTCLMQRSVQAILSTSSTTKFSDRQNPQSISIR